MSSSCISMKQEASGSGSPAMVTLSLQQHLNNIVLPLESLSARVTIAYDFASDASN
jgi:hypothetical protein